MTTLTKKELVDMIETLQWERRGYKETIRNREAEIIEKKEEIMAEWAIDSSKTIAYIHELQAENLELKGRLQRIVEQIKGGDNE